MYLLDDGKRRKVNLGGRSSLSHAAVIDEAKSLRNLRQQQKLELDNATCLQAHWRGILCRRRVQSHLRAVFEGDVLGISGLRCLALLGEEEMLSRWATSVVSGGEGALFVLAQGPNRDSWLVLIRRAASLLIASAVAPKEYYLRILDLLLVPSKMEPHLGVSSVPVVVSITSYLHKRNFFPQISVCIRSIPVQSKKDPCLPLLVPLVTAAFEIYPESSIEYAQTFTAVVVHILTIPLLPNRIPIASLTALSAKLPLSALSLLGDPHLFLDSIGTDDAIHLISNFLAFTPARYTRLSSDSLSAYLLLLTVLLGMLPRSLLDASEPQLTPWQHLDGSDSESEVDEEPEEAAPFTIDPRTLKRLQTLPSASHIGALLKLTWNTKGLMGFIIALTGAWPSKKTDVMATVLMYPGAGSMYVTQIYHEHIRDSIIGQNGREKAFTDPAQGHLIPAFVLLLDLYTQSLATMGDDEFFSVEEPSAMSSASRNPLSIDDIILFSRQLLRVVWTLYFSLDSENNGDDKGAGVRIRRRSGRHDWIQIRDKAVKCLLAIHARDSRRPFTAEGHWQECTKLNLPAFVEVAAREEEQVALRQDPLSARELAYFSPRLGILHNIPFVIPFFTRVTIFQRFIAADRHTFRMNNPGRRSGSETRLSIRRDHLALDGFQQLQDADLRGHISVKFIDKLGRTEGNAGHRGLYKEFFTAICKEVFDAERGLWFSNEKHEIYPNPQSDARTPESLKWFRFVGRILGKAIYDGILIDFAFAGFFLAKWLGKQGYLDDLASLDPTLYRGLIFLKHYAGDVEDLSLNFTVDLDDGGATRTIELLPDGANMPVTKENRLQYIYLISHFRLSRQIKFQSEAFFEGLSEIIDPRWLKMFNQQELQALLGGADSGIDVDDLKAHTDYAGMFHDADNVTIVAFWNVVHTFDQKERRALLHFVTSCSRAPLMGFKHLSPHFTIQDMGDTEEHLPGSATCSNLLLLPRYKDEAVLRKKLLGAIMSESGF
ncbi:HECT-domain-containing protein [Mycena vulgaris]|nr:HECT-domain-containing protein [Mycena vulgaris]